MSAVSSGALARAQWGAVRGLNRASETVRPRRARRRRANEFIPIRNAASRTRVEMKRGSLTRPPRRPPSPPQQPSSTARPRSAAVIRCGRSKKAKEAAKADKKAGKKASPAVSKQAKDKARKAAAAAMREVVSKQGRAYDRIVKEMDRDQYREYVLSVRHAPPEDSTSAPIAVLGDWLPICEVVVADKRAYEAQKFFKENGMTIPETEQQAVTAEQIEGVPAIKAMIPCLGPDIIGMTHAMAGAAVKDVDVSELEFGIEQWGSFENAVDGLEAQASSKARFAAAAKVLGVSMDDDAKEVKARYRKLIATEHPDRNPDASLEKFNAIKEAYELMSDRGGQSGATFEGLGDKAKRDFVTLEGVHAGVTSGGGAVSCDVDTNAIEVALRSLTIYDRIKTCFSARNVSLQARSIHWFPYDRVGEVDADP
jgi:hypothetical protein